MPTTDHATTMAGTTSGKYSLGELNALSPEAFVRIAGPVFEHSPWIAETAASLRPFESPAKLLEALVQVVAAAGLEKQLALIRAHPDLAGRLAQLGRLTPESTREQASAGLDQIDAATRRQLEARNAAYQARFGFPFIICARLNHVIHILDAMKTRLSHPRDREISTALAEIGKIAELRLRDLICPES